VLGLLSTLSVDLSNTSFLCNVRSCTFSKSLAKSEDDFSSENSIATGLAAIVVYTYQSFFSSFHFTK
jgi:hypothetical protein